MGLVARVQILLAFHIIFSFGKCIHATIPRAMDKIIGQTVLFSVGMATSLGE